MMKEENFYDSQKNYENQIVRRWVFKFIACSLHFAAIIIRRKYMRRELVHNIRWQRRLFCKTYRQQMKTFK